MRIIAGKWRSRRLIRPKSQETRPVPDAVREAIFNILGSWYGCPGALPPIAVADVFAGGGSMGLEALSRGAASCCFIERGRAAVSALQGNLDALEAGSAATILTRDAWTCAIGQRDGGSVELILLDPPYADSEDASPVGRVMQFLKRFANDHALLIVLHHRESVRYALQDGDGWDIFDRRASGSHAVTFFTR
ncbi:MAG: 16S rRNA (guanine(966)-N(2))-methyltransferase RsmD [Planctomycetes bacterium]|nr:16S rRNA (guanine(966)-N(2))-methyltransferase RsmD [Planctomycetota bacterium]